MANSDLNYLEQYGLAILSIIIGCTVYFFKIDIFNNSEFKLQEISIGVNTTLFGFLLTCMAIILQGTSAKITSILSVKSLINRVINFNRIAVILNIASVIFSIILIVFKTKFTGSYLFGGLYITILSSSIFYSLYFVILFYNIVKSK